MPPTRKSFLIGTVFIVCAWAAPAGLAHGEERTPRSILDAAEHMPVEIHGYLHLEYEDGERFSENQGKPTFELEHAILRLDAEPHERARLVAELMLHEGHELSMLQFFGSWRFHEALTFRIGRFLMPFGLQDRVYYCPLRWTNHYPSTIHDVIPPRWAEVGAGISGEVPIGGARLAYDLVVSNGLAGPGEEDLQPGADNNSNKLVGGRAALTINPIEVGASAATQRYDEAGRLSLTTFGGHAVFQHRTVMLRSEYIQSSVEIPSARLVRRGFYVEAGYHARLDGPIAYLQPVVRYELADLPEALGGLGLEWHIVLSLRAALSEWFLLTFDYDFREAVDHPRRADNLFSAGATVAF